MGTRARQQYELDKADISEVVRAFAALQREGMPAWDWPFRGEDRARFDAQPWLALGLMRDHGDPVDCANLHRMVVEGYTHAFDPPVASHDIELKFPRDGTILIVERKRGKGSGAERRMRRLRESSR